MSKLFQNIKEKELVNMNMKEFFNKMLEIDKKKALENFNKNPETFKPNISQNVISNFLCDYIVDMAEEYASENGGWCIDRHNKYPTTDLVIDNIPTIKNIIYKIINYHIYPKMSKCYNVDKMLLNVDEVFIVKYDVNGQKELEKHIDKKHLSFNILLNDNFEGGGTYFYDSNNNSELINIDKGNCIIHPGNIYHSARSITKGNRYVLVGFISYCELIPINNCNKVNHNSVNDNKVSVNDNKVNVNDNKVNVNYNEDDVLSYKHEYNTNDDKRLISNQDEISESLYIDVDQETFKTKISNITNYDKNNTKKLYLKNYKIKTKSEIINNLNNEIDILSNSGENITVGYEGTDKIGLLDMTKKEYSCVEKHVYEMFNYHLKRLGLYKSKDNYYCEYWIKTHNNTERTFLHPLHTDKDEDMYRNVNQTTNKVKFISPILGCISYILNDSNTRTVVTNTSYKDFSIDKKINIKDGFCLTNLFNEPNTINHITFNCVNYHGVINLNEEIKHSKYRSTIIMNIWDKKTPTSNYYSPFDVNKDLLLKIPKYDLKNYFDVEEINNSLNRYVIDDELMIDTLERLFTSKDDNSSTKKKINRLLKSIDVKSRESNIIVFTVK